ncbi:MAG: ABC transporter permease [Anaerolineaceae bacterium]|nr:ABC transporter permease [Anaerolineaceae bacterium]
MLSEAQGNRILQYVLVLIISITINFFLPRLMPGNPLALLAGAEVGLLSPEERAQVVADASLDQPLWKQYVKYLGKIVQGDFGYSYRQKRPIIDVIAERIPWSLLIAGASLVVSAILGIALGALAGWNRGKPMDLSMLWGMIMVDSLPSFWIGMLLVSVFAVQLGWLPSHGAVTPGEALVGWNKFLDIARHAVMPVITLSLLSTPNIFLTMRYTMLGIIGEDFIRTARAKGLSEKTVLFRHVVRNALAPVVTILALRLGFAFGGTVVTETVFSYPGLGRLIFEAVSGRDYPVMQAAFLLFTIAMLLSNLLADLIYPMLDPRAKL